MFALDACEEALLLLSRLQREEMTRLLAYRGNGEADPSTYEARTYEAGHVVTSYDPSHGEAR